MPKHYQQQQDRAELDRLLGFRAGELDEVAEADVDGLLDAARRLASAREAPPDTAATEALAMNVLQRLGLSDDEPLPADNAPVPAGGVLAMLMPQIRLLQAPFWLATAVVLVGGLLLAAWIGAGSASAALYLLIAAPLLTALGVSFAYYSGERLLELESTWPITPEQVIWGRTLLVVGYDIILATGASVVLANGSGGLPWLALVATWLAPLFGLAAVTLLAATYLGPWQGTALSTGLWSFALFAHVNGWISWFVVDTLQDGLMIRLVATVALAVALWLSLRHTASVTRQRWLRVGWSG